MVICQCDYHPECKPTSKSPCLMSPAEKACEQGRIFQEIETPTLQDQLTELYEPVLQNDFEVFMSAVQRATESPDLNEGQRIKLFRHYYKPVKINLLEGIKTEPEKKVTKSKWVEL